MMNIVVLIKQVLDIWLECKLIDGDFMLDCEVVDVVLDEINECVVEEVLQIWEKEVVDGIEGLVIVLMVGFECVIEVICKVLLMGVDKVVYLKDDGMYGLDVI